jgi:hypothetical protein
MYRLFNGKPDPLGSPLSNIVRRRRRWQEAGDARAAVLIDG